ncbi:Protein of unknown function [Pyronema omphalodes CBS 100304]|uniref:Uncharacterized protein n=1 Tax=Pyronema omphalodes (strain CBS 100304) TaxID=1076935 RepID=U4LCW2_PYROM|nr:Protein of unknown function [Pyronema omphalodes CBS 100304]
MPQKALEETNSNSRVYGTVYHVELYLILHRRFPLVELIFRVQDAISGRETLVMY